MSADTTTLRPGAQMYLDFCFPPEQEQEQKQPGLQLELHAAAMLGDSAELTRLLRDGSLDVNAPDARGCAAIHHAALSSSAEAAMLLLEHGADPQARTATEATPLHVAAYNGRLSICKLLVLHAADVHARDASGRTPLDDARFMASKKACPCTADTPDSQNGRVGSFLQAAMRLESDERASYAREAWELHVSDVFQTALHRHQTAVGTLSRLVRGGYRRFINARDYDGSTALHAAAQLGRTDAVRLLLDNGAELSRVTNLGETCLHFAAREGHLAAAKLLLDRGADAHAKSRAGCTPLDETRRCQTQASMEVASLLLSAQPIRPVSAAAEGEAARDQTSCSTTTTRTVAAKRVREESSNPTRCFP